jgi:hypothetical protein
MKKINIASDKEMIEYLAKAHKLSPSKFSSIIHRFGLITLFKDLEMYGSVEAYNEYLHKLSRDMKSCTGDFPRSIYDDALEAQKVTPNLIKEASQHEPAKEAKRRENARIAGHKHYHKNKEKINEECRKKYADDIEGKREYNRDYYSKNSEHIIRVDKLARKKKKDA